MILLICLNHRLLLHKHRTVTHRLQLPLTSFLETELPFTLSDVNIAGLTVLGSLEFESEISIVSDTVTDVLENGHVAARFFLDVQFDAVFYPTEMLLFDDHVVFLFSLNASELEFSFSVDCSRFFDLVRGVGNTHLVHLDFQANAVIFP